MSNEAIVMKIEPFECKLLILYLKPYIKVTFWTRLLITSYKVYNFTSLKPSNLSIDSIDTKRIENVKLKIAELVPKTFDHALTLDRMLDAKHVVFTKPRLKRYQRRQTT